MFGNIVPLTTVGAGQVLPTNNMGNNDLVIIQDTGAASTQAELINQLQNHITENQQILIITDDQGQDQCKIHFFEKQFPLINFHLILDVIIDKDQDINALLQDGKFHSGFFFLKISQFKDDDHSHEERIYDTR